MTCTLPTPAEVKNTPFSAALKAVFNAIADADVQLLIDNCASFFGSAEVKRHTQRCEAVRLGAAHLLYLQLGDEGVLPGVDPGIGVVSARALKDVGSISYAVTALAPGEIGDWMKRASPFLTKLTLILDTFPPGIATASGWPCDGPPPTC